MTLEILGYFDELGNDYKSLSSAKRQVQKLADKHGCQIDIVRTELRPYENQDGLVKVGRFTETCYRVMPHA